MSELNTRRSGKDENSCEVHSSGVFIYSEVNKHNVGGNSQTYKSDVKKVIAEKFPSSLLPSHENSQGDFVGNDDDTVAPAVSTSFSKLSKSQCDFNTDKAVSLNSNGDAQDLCSELSSVGLLFTRNSVDSSIRQHLQQDDQYCNQHSTTPALREDIILDDMLNLDHEQSKFYKGINNLSVGLCSPGLPQNVDQSGHPLWEQDQHLHQQDLGKHCVSFNQHLETGSGKHGESKDDINTVASDLGESSIISKICL